MRRDGITVTGAGSASGPPDVARVRLAATATRGSVAEAVSDADGAARRVRDALREAGVAPADLSTAQLTVAAEQVWVEGQGNRVTGYTARHGLQVTVRRVGAVGELVASALAAGGDAARLDGLHLDVEDGAALRNRARDAAWTDALARGEQLARLAGRSLGPVLGIEEAEPGEVGFRQSAAGDAVAEVAVEQGEVAVGVALTVRWELA